MLIECGGAYNFTTGTINASGVAGSAGSGSFGVGGSGGGGGTIGVLYNTLTANSGTYTVAGGAAGHWRRRRRAMPPMRQNASFKQAFSSKCFH
jgi:hypothetical protein